MQRPVSGYNQKDMEKHSKEQEKNHKKLADNANPKTSKNYFERLIDAAGEAVEAGERYVKAKYVYDKLPAPMKTPQRTKDLEQMKDEVRQERGQYFGALVKGAEYDSEGKQIKKKSNKKK